MEGETNAVTAARYDPVTIALHWLVALLVLSLWCVGQIIDDLPKGPVTDNLWSSHVVIGFGLTLLIAVRIAWRLTSGLHPPDVGSRIMSRVAKLIHVGLYAMLAIVLVLGIANAFNRGFSIYGLGRLPQLGDPTLKETLTDWHGFAANILLVLAFIHASAALFHHYVLRDGVLIGMLPILRRR